MNRTHKPIELRSFRRIATAACLAIGLGTCASALTLRMNVAVRSLQSDNQQTSPVVAIPRVSGGVMAGNRIKFVAPMFPTDSRAWAMGGAVVLHAIIGKNGKIKDLKFVSGPTEFRQPAMEAVRQWTYKPYLLNGQPTEVDTSITINYSLASNKH